MDNCYLCDLPFDEENVNNHEEHIIQNALGGKLTSREILCESCGLRLNESIDIPFIRQMRPLTVLLDLIRDRGESSSATASVVAKHDDLKTASNVNFTINPDFSVVPNRPILLKDVGSNCAEIVAPTIAMAHQYSKSRAVVALINAGYRVSYGCNVAPHISKTLLKCDVSSPEVNLGVLKIAIEYALASGVSRQDISHLLLTLSGAGNGSNANSCVYQYYPTTDEERLYETDKHKHEDFYPNHQLSLFRSAGKLCCYVELFGVVQKYVVLNDNYSGTATPNKYHQKTTKWDFDVSKWQARSQSDLHILSEELGVEFSGRQSEDVQRDVINRARSRAYALDPEKQISKVKRLMENAISLYHIPKKANIPVVVSMMEKVEKSKERFGFSILENMEANPLMALEAIRKEYGTFRIGTGDHACLEVAAQVTPDQLRKYASYKLYELLCFVGKETEISFEELV
jgi:hypothetical protein